MRARTAIRLSGTGSVTLASLETLEEMPADTLEILEGDEEGVTRLNGWGPTAIHRDSNGSVTGIEFRRCLRVYDESRRFSPVFDENDRRLVPCDTVVLASGASSAAYRSWVTVARMSSSCDPAGQKSIQQLLLVPRKAYLLLVIWSHGTRC